MVAFLKKLKKTDLVAPLEDFGATPKNLLGLFEDGFGPWCR